MSRASAPPDIARLAERVRGEYLEMPGLRLTTVQACRLWGLDEAQCQAVLRTLIDSGFLVRTADGAFARTASGPERHAGRHHSRPARGNPLD
jgi:hypothetical protein